MSVQYLKSTTISEQQYISCLLKFPDLIDTEVENRCLNSLSSAIFESLKTLRENNVSFDTQSVVSESIKRNASITTDLVTMLRDEVSVTREDFSHYRKNIVGAFVKDKVQSEVMKRLSTDLLDKNNEFDISAVEKTIQDLQWAVDVVRDKNTSIKSMPELAEIYEEELRNRGKSGNVLSSGDSWLDRHLYGGGLLKGQYAVVYGLSGVGKSIYALRCVNGLINKQIPCLYIPNEMGTIPTMDRLVAQRLEIPINELTYINPETSAVSEYVLESFREERKRLERIRSFRLVDDGGLYIKDVKLLIQECKRLNRSDDLVVVIDLFTMLKDFKGEGKANISEDAVNSYFEVLKDENVASMIVVQARRGEKVQVESVDDVEKFRPSTEMLKNSGAFEERARQVISVFRPKHYINKYIPDDPEGLIMDDIMHINIQKQNMGQLAELKYLYNGEIGKIWKYEEPEE